MQPLRNGCSLAIDEFGWRSTLTDALRLVLRTTVASLAHLESRTPLEILWTRLHAGLPERPDIAAVLVARVCADALDEAVGHRFVAAFRERRQWHVPPGEPFPIGEPALRDVFGRHLTTHPDTRDLPIDRTSRLALAPEADGVELVLDLDGGVAMPDAAAAIAVCLPIAAPLGELTWDVDRERGRFTGVRPRDPAAAAAAVRALTAEALSSEAAIVVFPELAVDGGALAELERAAAAAPHRPLVVAGSRHVTVDGEPRNLRGSVYPFPSAGASWSAQSQDDAYTICRGSSAAVAAGLTEGVHRFDYRGRVLGSDAVLGTNAVEAGAALRRGQRRRRRWWREGDGSGGGEGSRRL